MHRMKIPAALSIVLAGALSGCATPLFAGLTLGELSLAASLFSAAATGKGLGEHAMDVATGRDCRIVEGLARDDRRICEREDSPAVEHDWTGLARLADETAPSGQTGGSSAPPRDGKDG